MSGAHPTADRTLRQLRIRWVGVALVALVVTILGYGLLGRWVTSPVAVRWLLLVAGVLAYVLALFWVLLPSNRRDVDGTLTARLGPATATTVGRGVLVAFCAGFLLVPEPRGALGWLPAILFGTAVAADVLDGVVARLTDHVTILGARLDTEVDAIAVLVACALAIRYGRLPGWYLAVGIARYAFVAGIGYRRFRERPVFDLPPRRSRRALCAIQLAFLTVVLTPLLAPPVTTVAGVLLATPFLLGFVRDWAYVSGRLVPETSS